MKYQDLLKKVEEAGGIVRAYWTNIGISMTKDESEDFSLHRGQRGDLTGPGIPGDGTLYFWPDGREGCCIGLEDAREVHAPEIGHYVWEHPIEAA